MAEVTLNVRLKRCNDCGCQQPIECFALRTPTSKYRVSYCNPCRIERSSRWNKANPDKYRQFRAKFHAKNRDQLNAARRERGLALAEKRMAANPLRLALVAEKVCGRCGVLKHSDHFNRNPRYNDGLQAWCCDCVNVTTREWGKRNRHLTQSYTSRRRAREKEAAGDHAPDDIARIMQLQRGKCAVCTKPLGLKAEVDHIMPLSKGGTNWPRNLQLLCQFCNRSKHARDPIEFMQSRGRLL